MKPVQQTIFGEGGNCFQACVASILEMPLEQVPHFCATGPGWWFEFEKWLACRGMLCIRIIKPNVASIELPDGQFAIASGPSSRGLRHSIVIDNTESFFDPHPNQTGLEHVEEVEIIVATNLVAMLQFLEPACRVSNEITNRWPCPFKKDLCRDYQSKLWRIIEPMEKAKKAEVKK